VQRYFLCEQANFVKFPVRSVLKKYRWYL